MRRVCGQGLRRARRVALVVTRSLTFSAHSVIGGHAAGEAFVLDEPLSFWGGLNSATGLITDPHHPQHGLNVAGKVLALPFGRGSSSASSVMTEAVRLGTAPVGLVMVETDEIITLGALVGQELYGITTPISLVDRTSYGAIATGDIVAIKPGSITLTAPSRQAAARRYAGSKPGANTVTGCDQICTD